MSPKQCSKRKILGTFIMKSSAVILNRYNAGVMKLTETFSTP